MNRIDGLIANPNVYYNGDIVEGWVRFCENELTLTDGANLKLLDTFKLWGEQVLGWWYFETRSVYVPGEGGSPGHHEQQTFPKRLVNKQYLIVARGAAKTMYAAFMQAYFLVIDPQTTHQITTAPTMRQADEVMSPLRTAIVRARGPLFKFLTEGSLQNTTGARQLRQKLVSTKKGIENLMTGSLLEIRPMSIDKLQGLRNKISTVDEWLSGDIREDVVGALEQGASKVDDWLIIATSSEGTVRNSRGDDIKMELNAILNGEYNDPHTSIFYYKLDTVDEVGKPEAWMKAQPNLGKTVSYDTYHRDVERAENVPAVRNDILAKRFGLPMEGYTYFFSYDETLPHRRANFDGMPCAMGVDLSQGDDFCAFGFLIPLSFERFGFKSRAYISSLTLMKLPPAARQKYERFINEGSLVVLDGTVLDYHAVYQDLADYIERHAYDVRALGYDPYNAREFLELWERDNGPYGIEKVIQGARTESVPLMELKKLAGERLIIFDQEIVSFAMGNAIGLQDTNGNIKLSKLRREAKIDQVATMMDAYIAWKRRREEFE